MRFFVGWIVPVCLCLFLLGCRGKVNPTSTPLAPPTETSVAQPPVTPVRGTATDTPQALPGTVTVAPAPGPITGTVVPVAGAGVPRLIGTYVPPNDFSNYCQQMRSYGAGFTWVAIPWDGIEPLPGVYRWNRADQVVMAMHNCGFDIGVHVLSRHPLLTQPVPNIPTKDIASMPPLDMNSYYDFVFQLAKHYKGIISRYSIENEAHASSNWPSSPESYFQLLATAYRAVHAADPNALVEDSALSSSGLGVLLANDMWQAGKKQEATDFLHTYYAHYAPKAGGGEPIVVNNEQDLQALLAMPEVQRLIAWAPMLFANHQYYDVEQLHYFGPWQDLPMVMGWVHDHLKAQGDDKPLDLWEMGYGWTDVKTYDPQTHARDEPKYLATAIGEGGLRALSWLFTDFAFQAEGHPGLTTASGPRPAAESFKLTAEKLNGTTNSQRLSLGPGLWGYRFDKPGGTVYVLWGDQAGKINLGINAASVRVTDITGQVTNASPDALNVSDSPIFVEP